MASSSDTVNGVGDVNGKDPDFSSLSGVLPQNADDLNGSLEGLAGQEDENPYCALYSNFVLPHGVCSLGEIMVSGILTIPSHGAFYEYKLNQFTIGELVETGLIRAALAHRIVINAD